MMQKLIFFILAFIIIGIIFYLGLSAVIKGIKAKKSKKKDIPKQLKLNNKVNNFLIYNSYL